MKTFTQSSLGTKIAGIVIGNVDNIEFSHHLLDEVQYEGDNISVQEIVHHSFRNKVIVQILETMSGEPSRLKLTIPVGLPVLVNPRGVDEWIGKTLCS